MMRTTVTLDDRLTAELKQIAVDTGPPFEVVINEAIRTGLVVRQQPLSAPYRSRPSSLGALRVPGPLEKALQLADELEDAALLD